MTWTPTDYDTLIAKAQHDLTVLEACREALPADETMDDALYSAARERWYNFLVQLDHDISWARDHIERLKSKQQKQREPSPVVIEEDQ